MNDQLSESMKKIVQSFTSRENERAENIKNVLIGNSGSKKKANLNIIAEEEFLDMRGKFSKVKLLVL